MIIKLSEYIYLLKKSDNSAVVANCATNSVITLNHGGYECLKHITTSYQHFDTIFQKYFSELNIVPEKQSEIKNDYIDFIKNCHQNGIIEIMSDFCPKTLVIELTQHCNEKCKHCYIPRSNKQTSTNLELKFIIKAINEFKELGGEKIILTGGEIFLFKDLLPIISHIHSLKLGIILFSNLTMLTQKTIEFFREKEVKLIQTSLYGASPQKHDEITQIQGSFKRTLFSLTELKKNNIRTRVVIVLMKQNYQELPQMIDIARKTGAEIGIETVVSSCYDQSKENLECRLSQLELIETLTLLKVEEPEIFMETVKVRSKDELFENPVEYLTASICDGGKDTLYLTSEGEITPCPQLRDVAFGNIKETSISKALRSEKSLNIVNKKGKDLRDCHRCEAFDYCKWCIGLNYTETGEFNPPLKEWCEYFHRIMEVDLKED